MKRLIILLALLVVPSFVHATTWFADAGTCSISTTCVWHSVSGGNCVAGSGTLLTWPPASGDVLDANGCTALAINADPGAATGASQGVCGTVTSTVTLQGNATNNGAFTLATSANLIVHANLVSAGVPVVALSGSTNGATICGTITGGTATNAFGLNDTHTTITVFVVGNVLGGTGTNAHGISYSSASGTLNVTGTITGGAGGQGLRMTSGGTAIVTGDCVAYNGAADEAGCVALTTGTSLTLTGNSIAGPREVGAFGFIRYTPAATNYICMAKDASYSIGTEDCTHTGGGAGLSAHATELPLAPAVTNVKSGVAYGSLTGTLAGGGQSVCTFAN